ncbi:MAG TPA: hypothetical protein VNZ57_10570 [Longimicrobiales bacterium]|nr:hypothetical protein [Longimicrobiales bacterium]
MGRQRKARQGQQPPIRGFRPGREPPQLRKQRVKQQLGPDASWAQKQLVDAIASRSPEESRRMMSRWLTTVLAVAIALTVLGLPLYLWWIPAGITVHVLAGAAFFLWYRLHRQREQFDAIVDLVSGRPRR